MTNRDSIKQEDFISIVSPTKEGLLEVEIKYKETGDRILGIGPKDTLPEFKQILIEELLDQIFGPTLNESADL